VQPGLFTYTRKCPVGVVGHIVPWNYPVLEMVKMIAPCIAAGCTSVYKTSEWCQSRTTPPSHIRTPWSGMNRKVAPCR